MGLPTIPQGCAGFRSAVRQFLQNREMACFSSVVDGFSVVGASSERPKDSWAQHLDPVDLFNVPALPREPLNGLPEKTNVALNQGVQGALNFLYLQLVCHSVLLQSTIVMGIGLLKRRMPFGLVLAIASPR